MFSRSTWLHLRIPFSYFLLPVFLLAMVISSNLNTIRILWVFFIVHILLYPASNGYNSYFDKDEKSIGGLKNPPPVSTGLYYTSLLLDFLALVLGYFLLSPAFSGMLLIYGLVSKAYSHPAVRLKKYPVIGWLSAGIFQGFFSVVMCYVGLNDVSNLNSITMEVVLAGALASFMLLGNYPMTQVYQHEEDKKRGDLTFSRMLGVKGTFYFVGGVFLFVFPGFFWFFLFFFDIHYGLLFAVALGPVAIFFVLWFRKILKDETQADFSQTMWLNFISATCLNLFFIYMFLDLNNHF